MSKWEYGEVYKKYDMDGLISIGTGEVMVHDLTKGLPKFMEKADILFIDPPCSVGNLKTFYTKADVEAEKSDYQLFVEMLFNSISKINPREVFIEVFASNKEIVVEKLKEMYRYIHIIDSYYYHSRKNKCWIVQANNTGNILDINNKDEQNIIEFICKNVNYNCIGDLCMGRGLVGFYSNKYQKSFVGTELNKKRLAVLLERIHNGKI